MPSLIQVFYLSFPSPSAQWIFIVTKWKGFKQESSKATEQTCSLVAESPSTDVQEDRSKPLSQFCAHPASPGMLLPVAPHRPLESWEWERASDSWSFHLLVLNFCVVISQHLHFQSCTSALDTHLPMLTRLGRNISSIPSPFPWWCFPLKGMFQRCSLYTGHQCQYYLRLFLCLLWVVVLPGKPSSRISHLITAREWSLMTCRKYQEIDLLLKK